jgi:hypothetical protein
MKSTSYNDSPFGLCSAYIEGAKAIKAEDEAYWADKREREIMDFKSEASEPLPPTIPSGMAEYFDNNSVLDSISPCEE